MSIPKLLTPSEAAEALGVARGTLSQWRFHNRYPLKFVRVGRSIRYRESDVLAFIEGESAVRPRTKRGAR